MVIAYHLIWTAYGFWLPNDIRGSTSRVLRNDILRDLGEIHLGRKRIQPRSFEIREFFGRARELLEHPVVEFTNSEVGTVAQGVDRAVRGRGYTCYACAIMPDHVHVVIRKHRDPAERMIAELHRESHLALRDAGHRDWEHPIWGGKGWKVFLEDAGDIRRTVKYVEDNPIKMGRPRQEWGFVIPYDGWVGSAVRVVKRRAGGG
jgi:REP element-mobilizing transposase RayT